MTSDDMLPRTARRYLATRPNRRADRVIRRFHRWLHAKHIAISGAGPEDLSRFFEQPFRKIASPRTARQYKLGLFDYLCWLYDRGAIDFDPRSLGIHAIRPLPPLAKAYIRALEPTHRLSTRNVYMTSLRRFHAWLEDARVSLRRLRREHIEQWCLALNDKGLRPSSRQKEIINVRVYLRWLSERGELRSDPNDLVRSSDFPKLPTYLPRPLPQEIDDELQRRLRRASTHSHYQALLLMRQTGIRIGELQRLSYSCVSRDAKGRCFLKVPLGKLNNERLVPLSDETVTLIDAMRAHGPPQRPYLVTPRPTAPRSAYDKPVPQGDLRAVLRRVTGGLETSEPIVTHRLRHTYATSLLNAGMSLVSVMKLLGHCDYRMTLRYAAITQDTVTKEYDDAVRKLREQYPTLPSLSASADNVFDPVETINRLLAWTHTAFAHRSTRLKSARSLSKRLRRIRTDLNALLGES